MLESVADELRQAREVVVDHLAAVAAEPAAGLAGGEAQDHGADKALGPPGTRPAAARRARGVRLAHLE
jgi:hypothetical protein